MRITAIEPQKRAAERVSVHVDGEFRLGVARQVLLEAALGVGDDVTEARLAELQQRDTAWKARQSALDLLSHRARAAAELRDRLVRKGFAPALADGVVAEMAERGYVDDDAFARSFVRDRVRMRPRGRLRLIAELRAKGVSTARAQNAIDAVFDEDAVSEETLAERAAREWSTRNPPGRAPRPTRRRRLHAYLARRGFASDAARQAVDRTIA